MMRRAKRPSIGERAAGEIARNGMDQRNFQQFARASGSEAAWASQDLDVLALFP
jgi:hypothetical protein